MSTQKFNKRKTPSFDMGQSNSDKGHSERSNDEPRIDQPSKDAGPNLGRTGTGGSSAPPERPVDAGASQNGAGTNLTHENREERMHVRLGLPFELLLAGKRLPGSDISVGGLSTERPPEDMPEGSVRRAEVAIRFSGFRATIPVGVRLLSVGEDGEARFEFAHISDSELSILRRILRSYLSGQHLTIEQLSREEDPQTVRNRVKKDRAALPKPTPNYIRFGFAGMLVLLLVVGLGSALYEKLFIIEPSFAAITAPKIDIRAPNDGRLAAHDLHAGDDVQRDQKLVQVIDPEIKAQLDVTKATLAYNDKLVGNLQKSLEEGGDDISIVASSGDEGSAPIIKDLSPLEARARVREFESAREFSRAKIDALQTKLSSGTIYAPCDCLVTWIRSEAGGYFVQKGERIAELVVRDSQGINVEALVHLDDIDRIEPSQEVNVILPTTGKSMTARVDAIQLESERVERAGFPKWARQDMSHGSVVLAMQEPLPPQMVGTPVEVRFVDADDTGLSAIASVFKWVSDKASQFTDSIDVAWDSMTGGAQAADQ